MAKKEKQAILYRNSDIPTEYYFAGKTIFIRNVGEIPRKIQKIDDEGKVDSTYIVSAVTTKFIYYLDQICDSEETVMITRKFHLVSDNYFAYDSLSEIVGTNESLLWMSKTVKIWQREQYIQPHWLTPEIIKKLNKVDIDILIKKQKKIYYAFLNNGPVKYTKAEALMAVFANADLIPDITLEPQKLLDYKKTK